jgi:hypothetical protein
MYRTILLSLVLFIACDNPSDKGESLSDQIVGWWYNSAIHGNPISQLTTSEVTCFESSGAFTLFENDGDTVWVVPAIWTMQGNKLILKYDVSSIDTFALSISGNSASLFNSIDTMSISKWTGAKPPWPNLPHVTQY